MSSRFALSHQRRNAHHVFLSHARARNRVLEIASGIRGTGARVFVDEIGIETGDEFEKRILRALKHSDELCVLLTPWSVQRPYVWMEIGAAWQRGIRIAVVLERMSVDDLLRRAGTPILMRKIRLVHIAELGRYYGELRRRVRRARAQHA